MFGRMFELDVLVLCCKFQRVPARVNVCDVNIVFLSSSTKGFCGELHTGFL